VIGHFSAEHAVAGGAGIRPYVYVADVEETLGKVAEQGGAVAAAPYPEGDLRVATFRDPAGNVVGIWQRS
jgi:predicted enzyme related to lactoylglutathione lyase